MHMTYLTIYHRPTIPFSLICEKNEISRASAYEAISSSLNYTDAGLNEMDYFIDK